MKKEDSKKQLTSIKQMIYKTLLLKTCLLQKTNRPRQSNNLSYRLGIPQTYIMSIPSI